MYYAYAKAEAKLIRNDVISGRTCLIRHRGPRKRNRRWLAEGARPKWGRRGRAPAGSRSSCSGGPSSKGALPRWRVCGGRAAWPASRAASTGWRETCRRVWCEAACSCAIQLWRLNNKLVRVFSVFKELLCEFLDAYVLSNSFSGSIETSKRIMSRVFCIEETAAVAPLQHTALDWSQRQHEDAAGLG